MKRIINSIIVTVFAVVLFIGSFFSKLETNNTSASDNFIPSENWVVNEDETPVEIDDYELNKYVKLGEIDDVTISVPFTEVNDEYVRQQINDMLAEYPEERVYETLDDDYVKEYFELDTVEDLYNSVKDYCTLQSDNEKTNTAFKMFIEKALSISEVNVPHELLNYKRKLYLSKLKKNIEDNGLTVTDYVQNFYGQTEEEFFKSVTEMIEESLKKQMMLACYAKENAIVLDAKGYESYKQSFISYYGYESDEALYKDYSESELKLSCLCDQVVEMLLDVIHVNYIPAKN